MTYYLLVFWYINLGSEWVWLNLSFIYVGKLLLLLLLTIDVHTDDVNNSVIKTKWSFKDQNLSLIGKERLLSQIIINAETSKVSSYSEIVEMLSSLETFVN